MPARDELLAGWAAGLDRAKSIGRARSLRRYPGVDFSSNDYLGLAKRFAGAEPLALAGSTGSRSLSGHSETWARLENELADWHAGEAAERSDCSALCFSSGYTANEGLLSTVLSAGDLVLSDALNHGSLIDGMRLSRAERMIFEHQDLDRLAELLASNSDRVRGRGGRLFVVTESLFGMDGDRTDLVRCASICDEHDALLIVDEAHATGCFGPRGEGLVDSLGLRDRVFATVHTCGKALGSHGAYVVGPGLLKDWLVQSCRHFIFSTALPDGVARRTGEALAICRSSGSERELVASRALALRARLLDLGLAIPDSARDHILPVVLGDDQRARLACEWLQERGFRVPAIRYPTVPEGQARLRISVRADHGEQEIGALALAFEQLLRDEVLR